MNNNFDKHIAEGSAEHALSAQRYESQRAQRSQIKRMIALEIITDPLLFGADRLAQLAETHHIKHREMLMRAPRDAIIATLPLDGAPDSAEATLLLPALSHIRTPVRPGEYVLAFFDDPDDLGSVGYWLSRLPSVGFVDDPNIMHHMREHDSAFTSDNDKPEHHFLNGVRASSGLVIGETAQLTGGQSAFERLITGSFAGSLRVIEPVGRHKRRVDDVLLEGARGAFISIGSERASQAYDASRFQRLSEDAPKSAAVMIAVGTGRSERTATQIVENSLGFTETAKDSSSVNANEGDRDIETDATSIHASQRCDVDLLLNLSAGPINIKRAELAAAMIKSDDVRFVARRSVRIVALGNDAASDGTLIDNASDQATCELAMLADDGAIAVSAGQDLTLKASKTAEIDAKTIKIQADDSAHLEAKQLTLCGDEHPAPAFDVFSSKLATLLEDLVKTLSAGTTGTPAAQKLTGAEVFAISAGKLIAELRAAQRSAGSLVSTKIKHG